MCQNAAKPLIYGRNTARQPFVHLRFIASLKLSFKFYPEDRGARRSPSRNRETICRADLRRRRPGKKGEVEMTGMEMASGGAEPANAEDCFGLGMVYSAGAGVAVDLVQAHKWFNIAAMRGHKDAAQLRREIAEQMSDSEIGCAQRAARDWLKAHPEAPAPRAAIRVAA
jgi:uncharacterized protein